MEDATRLSRRTGHVISRCSETSSFGHLLTHDGKLERCPRYTMIINANFKNSSIRRSPTRQTKISCHMSHGLANWTQWDGKFYYSFTSVIAAILRAFQGLDVDFWRAVIKRRNPIKACVIGGSFTALKLEWRSLCHSLDIVSKLVSKFLVCALIIFLAGSLKEVKIRL